MAYAEAKWIAKVQAARVSLGWHMELTGKEAIRRARRTLLTSAWVPGLRQWSQIMTLGKLSLFSTLVVLLWAPRVGSQEAHQHQHDRSEKLGKVMLPTHYESLLIKPPSGFITFMNSRLA